MGSRINIATLVLALSCTATSSCALLPKQTVSDFCLVAHPITVKCVQVSGKEACDKAAPGFDTLTDITRTQILNHDTTGASLCGWKPLHK